MVVRHPHVGVQKNRAAEPGDRLIIPRQADVNPPKRVQSGRAVTQRHGALIVFERETGLQSYIESGVPIDATPSIELLEVIFYPGGPLHDGAAILRASRVVAAACTLPLSETRLRGEMGLRHRAGLGVTEGTDAVSIIVSEETGNVSVAADGQIHARLDEAGLRELLPRLLHSPAPREES
ncbi:MAG: DNA integrity scanning protein DisA nucleotide-binding domain protein [Chloroflexi bacterium]|nr:DNA integrity scanning protein DisA nucleotide-binding domain protein [Chloroflexota bacterium]